MEKYFQVIENVKSQPTLKRLNIVTGLAAIEDLMENVQLELAKEVSTKYEQQYKKEAKQRVGLYNKKRDLCNHAHLFFVLDNTIAGGNTKNGSGSFCVANSIGSSENC